MEISVVIPCLNEENTIGECVLEAQQALQKGKFSGEVIVVDNNSNDCSAEVAKKMEPESYLKKIKVMGMLL